MRSKYNCPVCGKVPKIELSYLANSISCCTISVVDASETKRCVTKWKKVVKLFKKEYQFDSYGLPIVDLENVPMPYVKEPPRKP